MRKEDTVALLGGDEFVVMIENIHTEAYLIVISRNVIDAFPSPFQIDEHELHISTSIGVTLYPDDGDDPERLIKNADIAMYRAKE